VLVGPYSTLTDRPDRRPAAQTARRRAASTRASSTAGESSSCSTSSAGRDARAPAPGSSPRRAARRAAGLVRHRHRRRRRRRRRAGLQRGHARRHFAVAVVNDIAEPLPLRPQRRELPAPREPAARGAREHRAAYCAALVLAALLTNQPLILGALGLAVALAGRRGRRAARRPLALLLDADGVLVVVVNALVSRNGLTVLARFGDWGPFGQVDPTLEALCYGAVVGLELVVIIAACALASAAVDPDEVLRSLRRVSFQLGADRDARDADGAAARARRAADRRGAALARPGAARVAVMRAITANALDRALDVAATLEVRGYGAARGARRACAAAGRATTSRSPASAAAIAVLALAVAGCSLAPFRFYPTIRAARRDAVRLAAGLLALAVAAVRERRGIER
jgi:energy-coupling factor transport system permease protein